MPLKLGAPPIQRESFGSAEDPGKRHLRMTCMRFGNPYKEDAAEGARRSRDTLARLQANH